PSATPFPYTTLFRSTEPRDDAPPRDPSQRVPRAGAAADRRGDLAKGSDHGVVLVLALCARHVRLSAGVPLREAAGEGTSAAARRSEEHTSELQSRSD